MLLSDYTLQVQQLVHDTAAVDYTQADLTQFVNNARKRVGLDFHCVRKFFQGLTIFVNGEFYPMTSGIGGVTVTAGGAAYGAASTVSIAAPPAGGAQATAVPVIAGGVITAITMTNWGSGYVTTPAVTITPVGGGAGASATAIAMFNVYDILSIAVLFGTQRWTLAWMPWTPFQAFCRANTIQRRFPAVWSDFKEINQFALYPIPDQTYTAEMDVLVAPDPLINPTDNDIQIIDPMADSVQYYAAHLALAKLQNFEQADYYQTRYNARVKELQATRQDRRIMNIYRTYFRRMNRW